MDFDDTPDRSVADAAPGCSPGASPRLSPVTLASAPWDTRLVVLILRGGMDGLDVVQPCGDPNLCSLRSGRMETGAEAGAEDLDGFYALHPGLGALMPMWRAGELAFVHAVSTPYRGKRSHFDGQDLLEAGIGDRSRIRDGWLNRMLQGFPGLHTETAFAIGREDLLVLRGEAPYASWAPGTDLSLSPQGQALLGRVYRDDPLFAAAAEEAFRMSATLDEAEGTEAGSAEHQSVVRFAVERLLGDTRIAAFSINGWDTHNRQFKLIQPALRQLADTLLALKSGLGRHWDRTAVVAMTEFGRTARMNGTGGTDHGTGGAMLLAGGAIRGRRVYGTWPGLEEADLFQRRDLMPTADVRTYAASVLQGLLGLDRRHLEDMVFPGIDMGDAARVIA